MSRLTLLVALLLAAAVPVGAEQKAGHKSDAASRGAYEADGRDGQGTFSSADRNLIRAWLREAERRETAKHPPTGLPAGLQKNVARGKPLPPGWQNKLSRGTLLEHDYYSRGVMLPDDLLRRLSPPPPGSEILRIENQIIRLDAATRVILDIFGLEGY